eukprot:149642_1
MSQALILVGGYGTRLRPLTFSVNKPLIPFCNMPILEHQVEALVKVGVNCIILAVAYRPDDMEPFIQHCKKQYNVKIVFSVEETPLGTAGPLALAKEYITSENFFVLNSDVICSFPLEGLLKFHKDHGREGTIMVTQVKDPSRYGVILAGDDGKIESFVEKPKEFVGDKINAGIYCFRRDILTRIKPVPTSIEREVFPVMAKDGNLYRYVLQGYWADIGQPKDYLSGMCMHLETLEEKIDTDIAPGSAVQSMVHKTAKIGKGCSIGPNVVIGQNCVIQDYVRLERCVLFDGVVVKCGTSIESSIIGWRSTIGKWCRLEGLCVLGEDVSVSDKMHLRGAVVCPHKGVKDHVRESKIIL